MRSYQRYGMLVGKALFKAGKKGLSYDGLMQKTGLSYSQVAVGLAEVRDNGRGLGIQEPIARLYDRSTQTWTFKLAESWDDCIPWLDSRLNYVRTALRRMHTTVETANQRFGPDPVIARLELDLAHAGQVLDLASTT